MKASVTLTILVSTLNGGVAKLEKTVRIRSEKIKYLIVHQNPKNVEVPDFLRREDITIIDTKSIGLSNSRNLGLKNCTTEYALIADDDVEYIEEGINKVISIISNTTVDFLTFKIETPSGQPEYKIYPDRAYSLKLEKHWISSIEICVNVHSLKRNNISFDRRFGLGTILKKGEETILLNDIIKKGLTTRYYPIYVVKHPFDSSGKIKRSLMYSFFFLGAYNERNQIRNLNKDYGHEQLRNKICYYLGGLYIKVTNII